MQKIILSQADKKILSEYAEKEKPNESCALLFGKDDQVSKIFLTKNIEESPVNFTISNEQLIKGYRMAEDENMEIVGIFHSHPNSEAYPSNTDKKIHEHQPNSMDNLFRHKQGFSSVFTSGVRSVGDFSQREINQEFKLKVAVAPSAFCKMDLSGEIIFPMILTGDAGVISPDFPIGVGP